LAKKNKMKYFLAIFMLALSSVVFANSYAEYWFSSGDSFELDGIIYTIFVSSSSESILVQSTDGNNTQILSVGRCIETMYRSACYAEYSFSDNPRAKILLYEKDLDVSIEVTATENFVGEIIELKIVIANQNIATQGVSFTGIIPETIKIIQATGCTYTTSQSSVISFSPGNIAKNSQATCILRLESSKAQEYFFVGELRYLYGSESVVAFSHPVRIFFKEPYSIGAAIPKNIEPLENFQLNISMTNLISRSLSFNPLVFQIPSHFTLSNARIFDECINTSQFLECSVNFSLSGASSRQFTLDLRSRRDSEQTIFIRPKYTLASTQYQDDLIRVPIPINKLNLPETQARGCLEKENVLITTNLDTNISYYSGTFLSFRLFLENSGKDTITNIYSTIQENSVLVDRVYIPSVLSKNNHYLSNIFLRLPVVQNETEVVYVIQSEYTCPDGSTHVEFSDFAFKIIPIKDVIVTKEILSKKIQSGDEVTVIVNVSSENNISLDSVLIREAFPSNFKYQGTSRTTLRLSANTVITAYTYSFLAPDVYEESTFDIGTVTEFEVDGVPFTINYEFPIQVHPRTIGDIKVDVLVDKDRLFMYEPVEVILRFTNNESDPISNISMFIKSGNNFFVEKKEFSFPVLFPRQSVDYSFTIFSSTKNLSVVSDASFINQQGDFILIPVDFILSFKDSRYDHAIPEYTLDIIRQSDSYSRLQSTFINRYSSPLLIEFFGTSYTLDSYSEKEISVNFPFFNVDYFTSGERVFYSLLGLDFMFPPKSYTISERVSNIPSSENIPATPSEDPEADLYDGVFFEGNDSAIYPLIAIIFLLLFSGAFGALFFLRLYRKHSSVQDVAPVSKQPLEKAETIVVPDTKNIKPTSIFSFNEYEKYKETLEKK
jgi:hypothetical protein